MEATMTKARAPRRADDGFARPMRVKRGATLAALTSAGMDLVRFPLGKCVCLRDVTTGLYLCREEPESKFRWCRPVPAAARFRRTADARAVAVAYAAGEDCVDLMDRLCLPGAKAEQVVYPKTEYHEPARRVRSR